VRSSSLFKRSNGIWYILYYSEGGRRSWHSTGERNKPAALAKLSAFIHNQQPRTTREITLSTFSREFLGWATSSYSRDTIALYSRTLAYLRANVGDVRLSEITPRHLDRFKAVRLTAVNPSTVHIELRTLRAAFYTAVRWELLTVNPLKNVSLPRLDQEDPSYFTPGEFRKLHDALPAGWFRDLVQLAVMTGLRRGELVHLRWDQVALERRLLTVQGNGSFRTKGGRIRTVPLNDPAVQVFLRRLSERSADHVFSVNGRPVSEDWITRKFREVLRGCGLRRELHFHSLRHTFATWLLQRGVPIYEVSRLLGHSSVTVTEIYSHVMPSELSGAVRKLDDLEALLIDSEGTKPDGVDG